ncbi:MAG: ATP-binding cassette domain-containing protein, partial [Pseudomonadota bacterium]
SHDRRFLETLTTSTLWLSGSNGRLLDKGFASFEAWRDQVLEQQELEDHKLARKIAAEQEWLHKGVTARRRRNQGRLRALQGLREDWKKRLRPTGSVAMEATEAERSGRLVIEATGISKRFDDVPVVRDLSLRIQRGDRLGIVGPNGAGKTTLINLLTGALEPESGTVRRGANLEIASLDQRRESLDPEDTLADVLTGGHGDRVAIGDGSRHVTGYMKDFLFAPEQARTPVRVLSGGERGRLMLARALARPSNLLVLDEPTNDLDLETLDLLQEMLADYKGTVLLASHDRDFLDRVVTATIASEGDGRWTVYAGGYSDMMTQRGADPSGTSAARPQRRKRDKPTRAPSAARTPRPGLTFKERHRLAELPAQLEALQRDVDKYQAVLAEEDLYARDRQRFDAAAEALRRAEEHHAAAEDEWLQLELKREEAEGTETDG